MQLPIVGSAPIVSEHSAAAVRFPVDWYMYRRYAECTQWEEYAQKYFPNENIPKKKKERPKFKKRIEPTLLADPEFLAWHETFRTKISLAVKLVEKAIAKGLPFETVLFDAGYLAPELVDVLTEYGKK